MTFSCPGPQNRRAAACRPPPPQVPCQAARSPAAAPRNTGASCFCRSISCGRALRSGTWTRLAVCRSGRAALRPCPRSVAPPPCRPKAAAVLPPASATAPAPVRDGGNRPPAARTDRMQAHRLAQPRHSGRPRGAAVQHRTEVGPHRARNNCLAKGTPPGGSDVGAPATGLCFALPVCASASGSRPAVPEAVGRHGRKSPGMPLPLRICCGTLHARPAAGTRPVAPLHTRPGARLALPSVRLRIGDVEQVVDEDGHELAAARMS